MNRKNLNTNPMLKSLLALFGIKVKPPNPIQWRFNSKKISFNTYMVHITAMIAHPWRLYSQESDLEGPLPIIIKFEDNAFIHVIGELKEVGTLKKGTNEKASIKTCYYTSVVDFVQEIQVSIQPETLKGKIIYQTCTDKQCNNPNEIEFQIELA